MFAGAGAAGAAGVDAAFAGVEGSAAFGGALGCLTVSVHIPFRSLKLAHLRCHADDETLLLYLVRLDGVVILQYLA